MPYFYLYPSPGYESIHIKFDFNSAINFYQSVTYEDNFISNYGRSLSYNNAEKNIKLNCDYYYNYCGEIFVHIILCHSHENIYRGELGGSSKTKSKLIILNNLDKLNKLNKFDKFTCFNMIDINEYKKFISFYKLENLTMSLDLNDITSDFCKYNKNMCNIIKNINKILNQNKISTIESLNIHLILDKEHSSDNMLLVSSAFNIIYHLNSSFNNYKFDVLLFKDFKFQDLQYETEKDINNSLKNLYTDWTNTMKNIGNIFNQFDINFNINCLINSYEEIIINFNQVGFDLVGPLFNVYKNSNMFTYIFSLLYKLKNNGKLIMSYINCLKTKSNIIFF